MSELTIERRFAKDPRTVFEYVSQSEHLLKWWGPEGMKIGEHQLDFTRPGPWGSVMINSEGQSYKVTGEVLSCDPPKSVEISWAWHDDEDNRGHESQVRFEVESDDNGGSIFRLIHTGLSDEEAAQNHNSGWTSSLAKLERMAG